MALDHRPGPELETWFSQPEPYASQEERLALDLHPEPELETCFSQPEPYPGPELETVPGPEHPPHVFSGKPLCEGAKILSLT